MQIELEPVTAIRPYLHNPRHNDAAVEAVVTCPPLTGPVPGSVIWCMDQGGFEDGQAGIFGGADRRQAA